MDSGSRVTLDGGGAPMVLDELLSAVSARSRAPARRPAASVCVYLYRNTAFGFPYSPATQISEGLTQRYTFQGREASGHAAAGAPMYYRYRQYSAGLGRFSRRDPVLGGDPLYNAYGFPGSNGVNYFDPFGLEYKLVVVIDQPGGGRSTRVFVREAGGSLDVGHAFVILVDTDDKTKQVTDYLVAGFYPVGEVTTLDHKGKGRVRNDFSHINKWDVKKEFVVTKEQYCAAKAYVEETKTTPPDYDVQSFNCVTYVMRVATKAGQNLPDPGKIPNPGSLGEELARAGGARIPKQKPGDPPVPAYVLPSPPEIQIELPPGERPDREVIIDIPLNPPAPQRPHDAEPVIPPIPMLPMPMRPQAPRTPAPSTPRPPQTPGAGGK